MQRKFIDAIREYLKKNPYRLLMPAAHLQSQMLRLTDKQTFEMLIGELYKRGIVYKKDAHLGLGGYEIRLKPKEQQLAHQILTIFKETGFSTPLEEDICRETGATPETFGNIMTALMEQGYLVRISEKVTYHREYVEKAKEIVTEHINTKQNITVADLRDKLGISRKYALAILEYFDAIGLTKREGDKHLSGQKKAGNI